MRQCTAIKANGQRCTLAAKGQQSLCWMHDPANAEQRRRTASRGGKSRVNRELTAIKVRLSGLVDDVLAERVSTGAAAVAGQLLNAHLRALETERRWRELGEIEERIAALEQRQEGSRRSAS